MVRIPPPIWMFLFLAIAAAASRFSPAIVLARQPVLGIAFAVAGIALGVWAVGLFRLEGTELNPASQSNKKLVIRGPYRFTRNPMYLCLVLFSLGVAFWVGALPLFAVPLLVFAVANWAHIPFEEDKMRRQFGNSFDAYVQTVRRWI